VPTPIAGLVRPKRAPQSLRSLGDAIGDIGAVSDVPEVLVSGVSLDSRRIAEGDLYAALPGEHHHGAAFIAQAAASGAVAVLTDPDGAALAGDSGIPTLVVSDPRAVLGRISASVYGDPAKDLAIVGITGTDGKTTTAMLLEAALRATGVKTGLIGTVATKIIDDVLPAVRTTPEAPDLHALLAVMRERGVSVVAMEVSSHALALGRVDGVDFSLAVFTNLGHDHLDFHGDLDSYFAAKAKLFEPTLTRAGLVCVDDEWGRDLAGAATIPVATYSVPGEGALAQTAEATWRVVDLRPDAAGWAFDVVGPAVRVACGTRLPGLFNVRNAVAAVASGVILGHDPGAVAQGVRDCPGVPGRMESVKTSLPITVLVDYAHTPEAVDRALRVAKAVATRGNGSVLAAVGCGGDRDPAKRATIGATAAELAEIVAITDDNPRSEDPAVIRAAVMAGALSVDLPQRAQIAEIGDRRAALEWLVEYAEEGDVVIALGKGHETGQDVDGVVSPFDDRLIFATALRKRES